MNEDVSLAYQQVKKDTQISWPNSTTDYISAVEGYTIPFACIVS